MSIDIIKKSGYCYYRQKEVKQVIKGFNAI